MNKRLYERTGLDLVGWAGVAMAVIGFAWLVILQWK
jgi:hypothetical protein